MKGVSYRKRFRQEEAYQSDFREQLAYLKGFSQGRFGAENSDMAVFSNAVVQALESLGNDMAHVLDQQHQHSHFIHETCAAMAAMKAVCDAMKEKDDDLSEQFGDDDGFPPFLHIARRHGLDFDDEDEDDDEDEEGLNEFELGNDCNCKTILQVIKNALTPRCAVCGEIMSYLKGSLSVEDGYATWVCCCEGCLEELGIPLEEAIEHGDCAVRVTANVELMEMAAAMSCGCCFSEWQLVIEESTEDNLVFTCGGDCNGAEMRLAFPSDEEEEEGEDDDDEIEDILLFFNQHSVMQCPKCGVEMKRLSSIISMDRSYLEASYYCQNCADTEEEPIGETGAKFIRFQDGDVLTRRFDLRLLDMAEESECLHCDSNMTLLVHESSEGRLVVQCADGCPGKIALELCSEPAFIHEEEPEKENAEQAGEEAETPAAEESAPTAEEPPAAPKKRGRKKKAESEDSAPDAETQ